MFLPVFALFCEDLLTVMGLSGLVSDDGVSRGQIQCPHPGQHPLGLLSVPPGLLWIHILLNTVQLPVMDHLCEHTLTHELGT